MIYNFDMPAPHPTEHPAHFNARSRPLGYETIVINGSYFIHRSDEPNRMHAFRDVQGLESYIGLLEGTPSWRLDLTHGGVNVDRQTGSVTPHDGSAPFTVHDAQGWSGSRPMNDMVRNADYLHIYQTAPPPYGGAWHKWIGL
ncbi:hypothetical protein [Mycobacterium numidiamassiliense]|uniref:hypothetical protein n=1 Tax=Mycobacterium numidiamassiliense TaxID=1841861 RepID=UPI0010548B3F|nr:hypothetical protein [Mycobacterium numidiamassiliense]